MQEAFATAGRPLSPQELTVEAQKSVPSFGIATAYRSIKELVESGWLVSVSTPAGSCFELAELEHHHHFFCRACERTFDIPGCVGNLERLTPRGFVAESHDLTVLGQCRACASGHREASART